MTTGIGGWHVLGVMSVFWSNLLPAMHLGLFSGDSICIPWNPETYCSCFLFRLLHNLTPLIHTHAILLYTAYNNKASQAEMQFKAQLKLNRAFHSKWVSLKVGGRREGVGWGGFGFRCYIGISELNCMCVCVCLVFHVWSVE